MCPIVAGQVAYSQCRPIAFYQTVYPHLPTFKKQKKKKDKGRKKKGKRNKGKTKEREKERERIEN